MNQFFEIHAENPQPRLLKQAVELLRQGAVIAYPTDSSYALACLIGEKSAMERIQSIRCTQSEHFFTLICRDLSDLGSYAKVSNPQYRLLKALTPGAFTFILTATKEVPRRLQDAKRSTIGLRIPKHTLAQALLAELGEPMLTTTLKLPQDSLPLNDAREIQQRIGKRIELIIDGGACPLASTTVLDLTRDTPVLIRQGGGDASSVLI